MVKAVLFDLDGTLLPMDQDEFTKGYFKLLVGFVRIRGKEPGRGRVEGYSSHGEKRWYEEQ